MEETTRKPLDVDDRIILEWISEKEFRKLWTGFIWLITGTNDILL